MSSFQFLNAITNPIAIDRALSLAIPKNLVRPQLLDMQAATQWTEVEKQREVWQLHHQTKAEREAQARARAQVHAQAQAQAQAQIESNIEEAKGDVQKQEQQYQHKHQRQQCSIYIKTRKNCRSRRARDQTKQQRRRRGNRLPRDAVFNPVACATVAPKFAVSLFQYIRHAPASPSLRSNSSSLLSQSRIAKHAPSPLVHSSAKTDSETGTAEDAERLQKKYRSESVAHASASALACGSKGVQPHGPALDDQDSGKGGNNSSTTTSATGTITASYSAAAAIAFAAASREGKRKGGYGDVKDCGKYVHALTTAQSARRLNAAATPFVATQNIGSQLYNVLEATNAYGYAEAVSGPFIPLTEECKHQNEYDLYTSAQKTARVFTPPYYNHANTVKVTDIANPIPIRPYANPFGFSSALSSFTPSLFSPPLPSSPPPPTLQSPPAEYPAQSPSPSTLSPNSPPSPLPPPTKKDLALFLVEEERLLSTQLSLSLRRQQEELELAQQQRRLFDLDAPLGNGEGDIFELSSGSVPDDDISDVLGGRFGVVGGLRALSIV